VLDAADLNRGTDYPKGQKEECPIRGISCD
jgi:hypothetical protein